MIEGLRQQLHLYLILRTHFVEGPKLKSSLKAFIVSIYLVLTWCILCLSIIVHIISHFNTLYLINGFNTFVFIKVFINNYNNYLCFFLLQLCFTMMSIICVSGLIQPCSVICSLSWCTMCVCWPVLYPYCSGAYKSLLRQLFWSSRQQVRSDRVTQSWWTQLGLSNLLLMSHVETDVLCSLKCRSRPEERRQSCATWSQLLL